MKTGELAQFTVTPEHTRASSDYEALPKALKMSTVVFEIELIDWVLVEDLFGDGRVFKTVVEKGEGWKNPQMSQIVTMSFKVTHNDGGLIEEQANSEYTIGSMSLGKFAAVIDTALLGMKKNERALLHCKL